MPTPSGKGGKIMPEVARVGDACRETVPAAPEKVIGPGAPTVLVGDAPAALVGGQIQSGCPTVLVNDKPLARKGDPTVTGGSVVKGLASVIAGGA
jgi:uncharacterized Zn-binding protein involved in type VI secretion